MKAYQMVCNRDGREINSSDDLRGHLGKGHFKMCLLDKESECSEFALAVNADKVSGWLAELTTGNLEENLQLWAKDRPRHLAVSKASRPHDYCRNVTVIPTST